MKKGSEWNKCNYIVNIILYGVILGPRYQYSTLRMEIQIIDWLQFYQ